MENTTKTNDPESIEPVIAGDSLDAELLELPPPPDGRRRVVLVIMMGVLAGAVALLATLRHDVAYFAAPRRAVELGDVLSVDPAQLDPQSFVRVRGTPMVSQAVRYTRMFGSERFTVFPLAGQRLIYVEVRHGESERDALARSQFSGRLITFRDAGRAFAPVRRYLSADLGLPVSDESLLLMAGQVPGAPSTRLLFALLCAFIIVFDISLMVRWFRPRPSPLLQPTPSRTTNP